MATAEAAAEIVREIAAVGAADLAAAAEPLRADCLRLARKVSLLSHLVAEITEAGPVPGEGNAAAWLRELGRALEAARRFVALGRAPPPAAGASDQVRPDSSGYLEPSAQPALLHDSRGSCAGFRRTSRSAARRPLTTPLALLLSFYHPLIRLIHGSRPWQRGLVGHSVAGVAAVLSAWLFYNGPPTLDRDY